MHRHSSGAHSLMNLDDCHLILQRSTSGRKGSILNDMIEQIDHYLVNFLKSEKVIYLPDVEMNSETPGSIIDRLSINALKIFHMEEETKREDADNEHIKKTKEKLSILVEQRTDLGQCLSKLLEDLFKGEKFLKIYRQMKMYNDESLNPVLYKKRKTS